MSPSTAPASTEASWSLSPSRIRRARGGRARTSLAIRARSTMEASSTTRTSTGRGFSRSCRKRTEPGLKPSSRWMVIASPGMASRISRLTGSRSRVRRMASCIRAAALPVGAASAIWSGRPAACSRSSARIRITVVVLPVPGPPEITQKRLSTATAAAVRCQSTAPSAAGGKSRSSPSRSRGRSTSLGSSTLRRWRSSAICRSYSQ